MDGADWLVRQVKTKSIEMEIFRQNSNANYFPSPVRKELGMRAEDAVETAYANKIWEGGGGKFGTHFGIRL